MKRYHNRRATKAWRSVKIPSHVAPTSVDSDWVLKWARAHNGHGRFYVNNDNVDFWRSRARSTIYYTFDHIWFEEVQDAEAFQAQLAWRLLQC